MPHHDQQPPPPTPDPGPHAGAGSEPVSRVVYWLLVALFVAVGVLIWRIPDEMTHRFASLGSAAALVLHSFGPPLLATVTLVVLYDLGLSKNTRLFFLATLAVSLFCFYCLSNLFLDWIVDDAAITFAYAENLVRGHGLVLFPGQAPEEGYSNFLWLMVLAAFRWVGFGLPVAAKVLSLVLGSLTIYLSLLGMFRVRDPKASIFVLLPGVMVLLSAPFIVWTSSGLENCVQEILLLCVCLAPMFLRPRAAIKASAACFAGLMLVRPETPLIAAVVLCLYAWRFRAEGWRGAVRLWPIVAGLVVSASILLSLRLFYFGDLLPNPFYAKASTMSAWRLFNLLNSGWTYIFQWLRTSDILIIVPVILIVPWRRLNFGIVLALGVIAAQFAFIIMVGADWMGMYRFVSPMIPLAALGLTAALSRLGDVCSRRKLAAVALVMSVVIGLGTYMQLVQFRSAPTTPMSTVAEIGDNFVDLAASLHIDHPTLAHHDAGGTAYLSRIDLIDLGGLGNRMIAKHMQDAPFIMHYLLDERKPTFVFGSGSFFVAGLTRFYETAEFKRDYVPIEFQGKPVMNADLDFIRRDCVKDAPGLDIVRTPDGAIDHIIVHPSNIVHDVGDSRISWFVVVVAFVTVYIVVNLLMAAPPMRRAMIAPPQP